MRILMMVAMFLMWTLVGWGACPGMDEVEVDSSGPGIALQDAGFGQKALKKIFWANCMPVTPDQFPTIGRSRKGIPRDKWNKIYVPLAEVVRPEAVLPRDKQASRAEFGMCDRSNPNCWPLGTARTWENFTVVKASNVNQYTFQEVVHYLLGSRWLLGFLCASVVFLGINLRRQLTPPPILISHPLPVPKVDPETSLSSSAENFRPIIHAHAAGS